MKEVAKNKLDCQQNDVLSFTLDLFRSLNNFYFLLLNDWKIILH